jgi:hypothetical protein
MSRRSTGISKHANRVNVAALDIAESWMTRYPVGVKMDEEMAWVLSNGAFGVKPKFWGVNGNSAEKAAHEDSLPQIVDTFKVALYVVSQQRKVA